MLFNSYEFLFVYFPVVLFCFFFIGSKWGSRLAITFLFFASILFYSFWNIAFVPLLIVSVFFNYFIGHFIKKLFNRSKNILLLFGVVVNLSLLIYYKYSYFILSSFVNFFDLHLNIPSPLVLPLGISFYTFTQIAFLVDAWRGDTRKDNFVTYGLFVSFFPHLIAGPILHHKKIIPQFNHPQFLLFSHANMVKGLLFLVIGLTKKVLIADRLAQWANPVFSHAANVGFFDAWIGVLSYTLQIYFDFSGYSDMAVGLAWMLNVEIPFNFNSPYKATSIIDFWKRWHMSLSQFLKDYLYIPLGGNRLGEVRRYINILTTMILGGLWHGAGFTFLFWGAWHGFFLVSAHFWRKLKWPIPSLVAWALTFLITLLGWVPFRAQNISDTIKIFKSMVGLNGFEYLLIPDLKIPLIVITSLVFFVVFMPNSQEIINRLRLNRYWAFGYAALAAFSIISLNRVSEFLYFQF